MVGITVLKTPLEDDDVWDYCRPTSSVLCAVSTLLAAPNPRFEPKRVLGSGAHMRTWAVSLAAACAVLPLLVASNSFDQFDTDLDGVLSRQEFEALANSVQNTVTDLFGTSEHDALDQDHGPRQQLLGNTALVGAYDFWGAFVNSFLMIIVTELGDKTFFIAAVLAMRQDRWAVYLGAVGALAAMTVLSAIMGFMLPNLLPRKYTHFASAALFVYFGFKLLKEASEMEGDGPSDELQEVEEELIHKKEEGDAMENGDASQHQSEPPANGRAFANQAATRTLSQSFTLTFLAEWGDRSQIATIALAAAKDPLGITVGGIIGHAVCTGIAVIGGRMLASRISEKTVAVVGGILFLGFAVHSFFFVDP